VKIFTTYQKFSFLFDIYEMGRYTLEKNWKILKTYLRSQELNISRTSLRRILHKELGMKPYKVQLVQELKPNDHQVHFGFAQWAQQRLLEDDHFYQKIIFSDEAHFHLDGYVNTLRQPARNDSRIKT